MVQAAVTMPADTVAARPSEWALRVARFGRMLPQEKVYLHTDNTCYFVGDTIWFAACTRRTDRAVPSTVSRVLYVELLSHDGYLVERQLVRMEGGRGHGNFVLTDSLYAGYYELRAYTRWQLNWGEEEHPHQPMSEWWFYTRAAAHDYFRDYARLYSRVVAVYDRPAAPGEYAPDMTLRPLRRSYADADTSALRLALFPEGGSMVAGVECCMAFECTMADGRYVPGTLTVTSGRDTVATAAVEHRGRGTVRLTPLLSAACKATFVAADGRRVTQNLPAVEAEGVAMSVDAGDSEWSIVLRAVGQPAAEPLGVTLMHEGRVEHVWELDPDAVHSLSLRADTLEAGIHQLTVFNAQGRVYADRLVFALTEPAVKPSLTVTGLRKYYAPHERITFTLSAATAVPDSMDAALTQAHVSVAVRDVAGMGLSYDTSDILTEMLLSSELCGFVPDAREYFASADEAHRRALDLLMLTQGWRRFDWHTMAVPGAFAVQHPAEYTPVLQGVVLPYEGQTRSDEQLDAVMAEHEAFMTAEPTDPFADTDDGTDAGTTADASPEANGGIGAPQADGSSGTATTAVRRSAASAAARLYATESRLKREVLVHAEFVKPGFEPLVGDMTTTRGRFQIQTPDFEGYCLFYLAASDTTRWHAGKEHQWVVVNEEEYPEYYLRIAWPYPRFVRPYTYYQANEPETAADVSIEGASLREGSLLQGGARLMRTVSVSTRRRGLRRFDATKPAFVADAYDAFNNAADAGLLVAWYSGSEAFTDAIARCYIGDMGLPNSYGVETRYEGRNSSYSHTPAQLKAYNYLYNIDKVYVYTDYSPRREGDDAYAADRPTVSVDLRRMASEGQRTTYRDRRYVLWGFSTPDDFYHPDYSAAPPPEHSKDHRRTLYWNPDLDLSAGPATISLYNNSHQTTVAVSADGQAADGTLLTTGGAP